MCGVCMCLLYLCFSLLPPSSVIVIAGVTLRRGLVGLGSFSSFLRCRSVHLGGSSSVQRPQLHRSSELVGTVVRGKDLPAWGHHVPCARGGCRGKEGQLGGGYTRGRKT